MYLNGKCTYLKISQLINKSEFDIIYEFIKNKITDYVNNNESFSVEEVLNFDYDNVPEPYSILRSKIIDKFKDTKSYLFNYDTMAQLSFVVNRELRSELVELIKLVLNWEFDNKLYRSFRYKKGLKFIYLEEV